MLDNAVSALRDSRVREADCTRCFCSTEVQQEEGVQEKRRERKIFACQIPVSEPTGFEYSTCKAFLMVSEQFCNPSFSGRVG